MGPTPTTLTRAAGVAAALAGLIFIGVQINHPVMDATSITSTEVVLRNSAKVIMAVLALVGITGMYLRQVRQVGVLGIVGYVVLGVGYLVMTGTTLVMATVLPAVAGTDPAFVTDVIAAATGNTPEGDIGALQTVLRVQDLGYLVGGLVFGIALYRARVLARWAAALLAVGGLVTIALSVMPDAFYRFLAFPNGIAMVGLGCSLWLTTRSATAVPESTVDSPHLTAAGAE